MSVESGAKEKSQSSIRETVVIILQAVALAMVVRLFFYQPFNIPSGSMESTLLVGDYLFVSKLSYGYSKYSFFGLVPFKGRFLSSEPKRGDVIVFRKPPQNEEDFIKRLIGLPGDKIQMRNGVLYINGKAVPKRYVDTVTYTTKHGVPVTARRYEEILPEGKKYYVLDTVIGGDSDNTIEYTVPKGKYFFMGDNRDNSSDSRLLGYVGYVPRENLIGRADIIFFSADDTWHFIRFLSWPSKIRWSRFFKIVN